MELLHQAFVFHLLMGCMLIDNVEMFVEFHQPVGVEELTDQLVFILLCCSPLLALAWCYVMYQISYRIFAKQEL